ncbi:MAG: hypothetical protein LPL00_08390 [Alphaproteobacteria bacterium]|nr:hypothetical protein [Alphaproteobacteria bacterium]MDX5369614.1 hypothetical protein [Alphaproteobacteria bacterium]MDX5464265.1 hypothetical protein [Alphaproteobacteria bacterium]
MNRRGTRSYAAPWLIAALTLASGALLPGSAVAAWTQKQGEGLAIVRMGAERADTATGRESRTVLTGYAAYGWRQTVTVGASARADRTVRAGGGSGIHLQEVAPFVRARLAEGAAGSGGWVVSVEARTGLPTGRLSGAPPRAPRAWEAGAALLAGIGHPAGDADAFAVAEAGYLHRFAGGDAEGTLSLTAGFRSASWLVYARGGLTQGASGGGVRSLEASAVREVGGGTAFESGLRVERDLGGGEETALLFLGLWQRF